MTWEETIRYIQDKPEFENLVRDAYLSINIVDNVERFINSEEFVEILHILKNINEKKKIKILDIGAGNGITSISFALKGFKTTVIEPDKSEIVGCNAIEKLKNYYNLNNIEIIQGFAEKMPFMNETFDVVFARQTMHHAQNLKDFVSESYRVLKHNGLFLTVRDHVIYNLKDKEWFLKNHPLQKYYGGENAFTLEEYKNSIINTGFKIEQIYKHFDSVINYSPMTKNQYEKRITPQLEKDIIKLKKLLGFIGKLKFIQQIYKTYLFHKYGNPFIEENIPGRLYSFLCIKN